MPVHDWTRVDAGTFHDFHTVWIAELRTALNSGLLPTDYYALAEQSASQRQTDVLTLHTGPASVGQSGGGLAVLEATPAVRLRLRPTPGQARRLSSRRGRRLVIRHVTGHRVVAVLAIVSPANKDRRSSVRDFVTKVAQLLEAGIHVMLIDLLPQGRFDERGMHGAVWSHFDAAGYQPPEGEPFTLASYRWDGNEPEAFVEPVALGRSLIDMPLFLRNDRYVNVSLEATYQAAYRGFPAFWRRVLEEGTQAE